MRGGSIGRIAAALAGALLASGAVAQIAPAPAFTPKDLTAPPTTSWPTNGGSLNNNRFSPLTGINKGNVGGLKARWRAAMGSGVEPGNSGQAQILAYKGTLYVSNGANDVFAIDVDSGKVLWSYKGNPAPAAGAPQGRSNRGVGLGDGKVFVSHLDGRLSALDQQTGKVLWNVQVEPWQEGFSITSAPLYYDGMVITGVSGGVMGRRCSIRAYDARTGKPIWTFYTIAGPGEFGHETWPQGTDAWQHGGAPVWQTPAVDPELGLLYVSTGNTGPVLYGAIRPGDNLFANTILALDVKTGKRRWHFQQVRHDIWDYDSPNPIVLFDAPVKGQMRKGLVQVGKTGWAYILDRATGKPLIGIVDRPVPQEPRQATAKTQPYPIGDSIVPHEIDIPPEGAKLDPATGQLPNRGRIFTPFWTEEVFVKPSSQGGASWPPSSYDPKSHLLYVCAADKISGYHVSLPLAPPEPNKSYFGGSMSNASNTPLGIFAALDVTTNKLVWRQQWKEPCYSGSVTTAAGLVFVGRSDGRLTALDGKDGSKLWEFLTDAGVNTTITTFEHKGQQLIAVHAGGSTFGNGKRGDGVWLFALDGTIASLAPPPPPRRGPPPSEPAPTGPADLTNGERLYRQACVACHGDDGKGGLGGGKNLVAGQSRERILAIVSNGADTMPAFAGTYNAAQLRDITAYVVERLQKK